MDQIFNKPQVHNMMTSMMISFDYNFQGFKRIGLDWIGLDCIFEVYTSWFSCVYVCVYV
jgi:hypothetical protein